MVRVTCREGWQHPVREVAGQNSSRETYLLYGFDTDLLVFPCEKALLWKILVRKGLGPLGDTPALACREAEAGETGMGSLGLLRNEGDAAVNTQRDRAYS